MKQMEYSICSTDDVIVYSRNALGRLKSTWLSVELNLLLRALILVKSGCFPDRETLQLATRIK